MLTEIELDEGALSQDISVLERSLEAHYV